MAKATNDTDAQVKTVSVPVVRVVLSTEEAQVLRTVLRNVGGDRKSHRQHVEAILNALYAANVQPNTDHAITGSLQLNGRKNPPIRLDEPLLSNSYFDRSYLNTIKPF